MNAPLAVWEVLLAGAVMGFIAALLIAAWMERRAAQRRMRRLERWSGGFFHRVDQQGRERS